ncbi:MAG: DsbA family protein, partial [Candidatus Limnocylindrales bacterium]
MAPKEPIPSKSPRRRRREELRREQAAGGSRPPGSRPPGSRQSRRLSPPKRPVWQSPTAIVTALAVIATIVLIVVVNSRHSTPTTPSALIPPANPVAASIPRDGATLGATGAPVTMDAWEDYQCPYCDDWTEQWEPHVITDFVATGIVKYQFHDYAFIGSGHTPDESLLAAVAAQCAGDQGKFWEYHGWLYANQNPNGENQGWFTATKLDAIAQKVGLDQSAFDTCRANPARSTAVIAERTAGTALGITGTPAIFVNGKQVSLTTYDALAATIRSLAPA